MKIINAIPSNSKTYPEKKIPTQQPYLHSKEKIPEPGIKILAIILIIVGNPKSDFNL